MLTLLIGYAIGTAQIVVIEWIRRRVRHRSDLRVLLAELRRTRAYDGTFQIDQPGSADKQTMPRPPTVSSRFADFVTQTELHLTDPSEEARTQEALLGVLDACVMFQGICARFEATASELRRTTDPVYQSELAVNLRGMASDYDRRLVGFMKVLDTVLRDVQDRLRDASTWRQLNRLLSLSSRGSQPQPTENVHERGPSTPTLPTRPPN